MYFSSEFMIYQVNIGSDGSKNKENKEQKSTASRFILTQF